MLRIEDSKLYCDELFRLISTGIIVHNRDRSILNKIRKGTWPSGVCGMEFRKDEEKYIHCVKYGEHKMLVRTKLDVNELRGIFDDYIVGRLDDVTYKAVMKECPDWVIVTDRILDWLEK